MISRYRSTGNQRSSSRFGLPPWRRTQFRLLHWQIHQVQPELSVKLSAEASVMELTVTIDYVNDDGVKTAVIAQY